MFHTLRVSHTTGMLHTAGMFHAFGELHAIGMLHAPRMLHTTGMFHTPRMLHTTETFHAVGVFHASEMFHVKHLFVLRGACCRLHFGSCFRPYCDFCFSRASIRHLVLTSIRHPPALQPALWFVIRLAPQPALRFAL